MAFAITQVRQGGGLALGGSCLGEKKWLDLWYISKGELTAFADGWDKKYERKRGAKDDSRAFGTRRTELSLTGTEKTTEELLISNVLTPTCLGFPHMTLSPSNRAKSTKWCNRLNPAHKQAWCGWNTCQGLWKQLSFFPFRLIRKQFLCEIRVL